MFDVLEVSIQPINMFFVLNKKTNEIFVFIVITLTLIRKETFMEWVHQLGKSSIQENLDTLKATSAKVCSSSV